MSERGEIREVDRSQAEAVLSVRLFVPGVTEGGEDRYYLTRTPAPRADATETVTRNPDGSTTVVRTSTVTYSSTAHVSRSHGRTGGGLHKSVYLTGLSADVLTVHFSAAWTAGDGSRGEGDAELVVPWLGAARAELSQGGWVTAEITPADSEPSPGE